MGTIDRICEQGLTVIPWIKNSSDANMIQDLSDDALKNAYNSYLEEVDRVSDTLHKLHQRKADIIGHEMIRFINAMMELKDVDYEDKYIPDEYKKMFTSKNILTLREETIRYCFNIKKCAPSLLIEIICINKRAKTMLMNAKADRNVAEIKIAQLETEVEKMNMIVDLSRQMDRFLRSLLRQVRHPLSEMERIIENNKSWRDLTKEDKMIIASVVKMMQVIKSIIDLQIVSSNGEINGNAPKVLESLKEEN